MGKNLLMKKRIRVCKRRKMGIERKEAYINCTLIELESFFAKRMGSGIFYILTAEQRDYSGISHRAEL